MDPIHALCRTFGIPAGESPRLLSDLLVEAASPQRASATLRELHARKTGRIPLVLSPDPTVIPAAIPYRVGPVVLVALDDLPDLCMWGYWVLIRDQIPDVDRP